MGGHLDIRHASKTFTVDGAPVEALDDVSLSIQPGEFVSIVGPSGWSKCTLLRLLAGPWRGFSVDLAQELTPDRGTY